MSRHVVIYRGEQVLVDRDTLARLTKRSVHTIRARCPVVDHQDGRALYDAEQVAAILSTIPTRRRQAVDQVA